MKSFSGIETAIGDARRCDYEMRRRMKILTKQLTASEK